MKRKYLALLPLAGMFLLCIPGCNKDEESRGSGKESSNSLVYEDRSLLEEVSPHFYDDHIYRIELMGANLERDRIVRAATEKGIEEDFLILEAAQKFFFNHSEVIMYSIPTQDPEQTLIVYETLGLYQVGMAHFSPAGEGLMSFTLKSMDDHDYFSLKMDDQNRIGEFKVSENEEVKSFNKAVYSLTLVEESQEESLKATEAECCRRESSWSECMTCTIDDCEGSWVCRVAGLLLPVEMFAGFAVSCLGTGPNANC